MTVKVIDVLPLGKVNGILIRYNLVSNFLMVFNYLIIKEKKIVLHLPF